MTKDAGPKVGAACGKPQTKASAPEKSAKRETKKPEKKRK
jgi:hypothetical protein